MLVLFRRPTDGIIYMNLNPIQQKVDVSVNWDLTVRDFAV